MFVQCLLMRIRKVSKDPPRLTDVVISKAVAGVG